MQHYFAPLEGLTDSIYRALHHKYFPGVDRYYTPFFSPTVHRALTPREARELPAADSLGTTVVPQILCKVSEDFVWMTTVCKDLGYEEVNLNLGCPSGTVTAKGKGSGMLRDLENLDRFLEEIFAGTQLPISIKTRIGFTDPNEFPAILQVLEGYPVKELTIHPRVRSAFYNGAVDMDAFDYAVRHSKTKLCYNGDLTSLVQIRNFSEKYPGLESVMVGRGLIADPGLFTEGGTTNEKLRDFLNELLEQYLVAFGGSRNAMFRLKEQWGMLQKNFEGGEKLFKQLRKTTDLTEFRSITGQILASVPFHSNR